MSDTNEDDLEQTEQQDDDEFDAEADEDEEIGDDLDVEVDDADAVAPIEADGEAEEETEAETIASPAKTTGTRGRAKRVVTEALHTVAAREDVRKQLAADVEAFLKRGGAIQDVAQDVRADPPKKPESNYGRGSI
jgi:SutA-like transcriptional regulator